MWCGVLFCVQVRVAGRGVIGTSPLARHDGSGINAGKRVIPLPALRGFSNRINHRLLFPPSHPFVEMPLNASPTAEIAVVYLIHAKSPSQARWIWVIVTHYSPHAPIWPPRRNIKMIGRGVKDVGPAPWSH